MLARVLQVLGFAATLAVAATGVSQTQATRSQPIRAGVVVLESARDAGVAGGQPISAGPHAWFNLDSDLRIKPVAWNIHNPNAPGVLTDELRARWSVIDPSGTPPVGTRLTKRHAAYWEVFLNRITDTALAQYDVLLVNPANYASLNPTEREKLRRFVDAGGLLWVDAGALRDGTSGMDLANNFPIAFMSRTSGTGGTTTDQALYTHPLLSIPNALGPTDVWLLNRSLDSTVPLTNYLTAVDLSLEGAAGMEPYVGGVTAEFARLAGVTWQNALPTMLVGRIGEGRVVLTSRGASMKLNRPYGATLLANNRFTAMDPILDRDGIAAAKLAVNMISQLGDFAQRYGGSRKTSSTAIDVGAPLLRRSAATGVPSSAPSIGKGIVVAVISDELIAYDADPHRDLDNDGNPDDGLQDLRFGSAEDVIWRSGGLVGPLSTPVIADVPNASGTPTTQVLVVDSAGRVHAYNLYPVTNGVLDQDPAPKAAAYSVAPPNGAPDPNSGPFAVTVHEEIGYVADTVPSGLNVRGRVWMIDLARGQVMRSGQAWVLGGGTSPAQFPAFTASPTVGFIPIFDNSGGMDKVMYLPYAPGTGAQSAGISSVWLGAKGERPSDYEPKPGNTGTALVVTTRASQQGGLPIYLPSSPSPLGVKLTLVDANGEPMPARGRPGLFGGRGMTDLFDPGVTPTDLGGGVLSFPFKAGVTSLPPEVAGVRIDYTIDLGTLTPGVLGAIERGKIGLPDNGAIGNRRIQGSVALSPGGTLWVTDQDTRVPGAGNNKGGVYALREEGRGLFRLLTRWEMYGQHSITMGGAPSVTYRPVLHDNDPFRLLAFEQTGGAFRFNGVLTQFRIVGPPAVRNGQAFVTAHAVETLGSFQVPVTIVMAFKAEPDAPYVRVGELPDGSSILQPDLARSSGSELLSTFAGANFNYNRELGIVRFDSLATVQKGTIQQSLSQSQPLIIRRPGRTDELIEPELTSGSRWSPMLWYTVIQGLDCTASNGPVVTGDTLYVAGSSMVPSILGGSGFQPVGMVYALRTDVSPNDSFLVATDPAAELANRPAMAKVRPPAPPNRPWLKQYAQFRITQNNTAPTGQSTFAANPGFLWPQLRNTSSIQDFIVRLNQASLSGGGGSSTVARGVVVGDGVLAAWGNAGLYTFSRTDFLVADENRIARFDPAGNMLWSLTAYGSSGAANSAATATGAARQVVRPTRAYTLPNGTLAVVDPGANRVSILDPRGIETRGITEFRLDKKGPPPGYQQNEPLSLSAPRDVLMYTTYERRPALDQLVTPGDGAGPNDYEYWVHYVIADSGNNRLIEIVDRYAYDATRNEIGAPILVDGEPQLGVLTWHSPSIVSGKNYAYNSISRVWLPNAAGNRYVYVAGVGSGLPTRVDTGLDPSAGGTGLRESEDGNGAVVIFDPADPAGTRVINRLQLPAFAANVLYSDNNGTWFNPARTARVKLLGNVTSVTTRAVPSGPGAMALAIMIADSSGVYETLYTGPTDGDTLGVRWMLPNEVYRVIRRTNADVPLGSNLNLRATYARRLDNGDVLLVNGFFGHTRDRSRQVGGEILQVDGTPNVPATITVRNMGFNSRSILFELPPIDGSRGLVLPVFADRK